MKEGNPIVFKELFFFKRLFTLHVLTVIYWLALVSITFYSLLLFKYNIAIALVNFFFGVIAVRLGFEFIMVVFSINENLRKLLDIKMAEQTKSSHNDAL